MQVLAVHKPLTDWSFSPGGRYPVLHFPYTQWWSSLASLEEDKRVSAFFKFSYSCLSMLSIFPNTENHVQLQLTRPLHRHSWLPLITDPYTSPNDLVLHIWACSIPHTIPTSHLLTSPRRSLLTLPQDSAGNPYLSSFPHSLTWQCLSSPRTASLTENSKKGLRNVPVSALIPGLPHTHSYLLLVTTPSRRTMFGWLNCPIIVASRRKFHHCESEYVDFRVLMATTTRSFPESRRDPR